MKRMTMKQLVAGVLLSAALLMASVSCNKSNIVTGDSVRFKVGLAASETRTSYSGDGIYTSGILTKERIDWTNDDVATVYSPEAIRTDWTHYQDYKVTSHETLSDNLTSRGQVAPVGGGMGLTWEAGTNHFYGMYPSKAMFSSTDAGYSWIALDGTTMKGTIPSTQTDILTWDGVTGTGDIVGTPDMKYAWMFANATGNKGDSDVTLEFWPKFTAFEFTIGSGENSIVHLTSFTLETTSANANILLAGNFSLANGNTSSQSVSFSGTGSKSVTVTFPTGTAVTRATSTADAKNLTFTVFTLPLNVAITSLKITFVGEEIGTRTLALNDGSGNPLNFTTCKKYRIHGLSFPNFLTAQGEDILWDLEAHGEALNWY